MKNPLNIILPYEASTRGTLCTQRHQREKNIIVTLPGFIESESSSSFVDNIVSAFDDGTLPAKRLYALDQPSFGKQVTRNERDADIGFHSRRHFTLNQCIESARGGIEYILQKNPTSKIVLMGNSLGAWVLFQALAQMTKNPRIRALLCKSSPDSYGRILGSLCQNYSHPEDSDEIKIQKLIDALRRREKNGFLRLPVTPEGIRVHEGFIHTICNAPLEREIGYPVEFWHGSEDNFTPVQDIKTMRGVSSPGVDPYHIIENGQHSLTPAVDSEMIQRARELLGEKVPEKHKIKRKSL